MGAKLTTLLVALTIGAITASGCSNNENAQEETGANAPMTEGETEPATDETTITPEGESSESGEQVEIPADPSGKLAFAKKSVSTKAGKVTITMPNPSDVPHAIGIRGEQTDETGETVTKGGESSVSLELPAGDYELYCPVPGHEDGGMTAELSVK